MGDYEEMSRCDHDIEMHQRRLAGTSLNPYEGLTAADGREISVAECPYASEIHENYRLCACCSECRHECAMDI